MGIHWKETVLEPSLRDALHGALGRSRDGMTRPTMDEACRILVWTYVHYEDGYSVRIDPPVLLAAPWYDGSDTGEMIRVHIEEALRG